MTMFRWTPEIQAGHVLQSIAIVVTIGGGLLGAYISINARMTIIETQSSIRLEVEKEWRDSVKNFMLTTNTKLESIGSTVQDLRIEVLKMKPNKGG